MNKNTALAFITFLFLLGCVPQYQDATTNIFQDFEREQNRAIASSSKNMSATFSEKSASYIGRTGKNSISGQGMLKTRGGDVKTSAGSAALLYPKTEYTDEMMQKLFGSNESGINQIFEVRARKYKNTIIDLDSNLEKYVKKTTCDAQGNFDFSGVPNGEYYVVTSVEWEVPSRYAMGYQGGDLMKRVSVKNGAKERVILTN